MCIRDSSQAATLPALLNALEVDYEVGGKRKTLVLEVQQHIGDGWVRAVAMSSTDGLRRGMPVRDTGRPIEAVSYTHLGILQVGRSFRHECRASWRVHGAVFLLHGQSADDGYGLFPVR